MRPTANSQGADVAHYLLAGMASSPPSNNDSPMAKSRRRRDLANSPPTMWVGPDRARAYSHARTRNSFRRRDTVTAQEHHSADADRPLIACGANDIGSVTSSRREHYDHCTYGRKECLRHASFNAEEDRVQRGLPRVLDFPGPCLQFLAHLQPLRLPA